jgi:pimeloyl-ACP methyl ester carboxylesterase
MEISEWCGFFGDADDGRGSQEYIHGCAYLPRGPRAPLGVLMVSPLGRERLRVYRESANLARDLAASGYPVLRFDYRGEGESALSFPESTLETRLQDIGRAAEELRRRAGVDRLCLLGLHFGATLAVLAAAELGCRRLLLCDPVCKPRAYARSLLRANVVIQSQYCGKITRKEPDLRAALTRGETVSIYGFQLARPLFEQIEALDPLPALRAFEGRAGIIYTAGKQSPPKKDLQAWQTLLGQCDTSCAVLSFSWTSRRRWLPRLQPINDAARAWLRESGCAP